MLLGLLEGSEIELAYQLLLRALHQLGFEALRRSPVLEWRLHS